MRNGWGWLFWSDWVRTAAAVAALFALATAPRAHADDDCQRKVAHADHQLHEAIEHHGYESKQAEHWRHELHEARERCWSKRHRWWNEDDHRWHVERDWDDHDHERLDDRR